VEIGKCFVVATWGKNQKSGKVESWASDWSIDRWIPQA
jgi:hypothetical protein